MRTESDGRPSNVWHVPPPITALVGALPKAGEPMHPTRKRQFLQAISALMNMYYPDKKP